MSSRVTIPYLQNMAQMSCSRATARDFDDNHLMCQIKYADVMHSETPSDFERWQMCGLTCVPLKQDDEDQQQKQQQDASADTKESEGDWNHNQPKGKAAELLMLYPGGSRSHMIGICDDRRVRPYGMQPGDTACYAADGSEQMFYMNSAGAYLVSLDGVSHGSKGAGTGEKKTRYASLRHVKKDMQSHKIQTAQQGQGQGQPAAATTADASQGQQQQRYPHEGKEVNTEVRCTADRIEFRAGDKVMGYFEVSSSTWNLNGKVANMDFSDSFTRKANQILDRPGSLYELEEGANSLVEGQNLDLSGKVKIKHALDDVPDGLRALEQRIVDLEARLARLEN